MGNKNKKLARDPSPAQAASELESQFKKAPSELKKLIAKLSDETDGMKMKLESYMAKINSQEKLIEQLKKENTLNRVKAQAYKEIAFQIIDKYSDKGYSDEMHFENTSDGWWKRDAKSE